MGSTKMYEIEKVLRSYDVGLRDEKLQEIPYS